MVKLLDALSAHGALDLWSDRFTDPVRERAFKAYSQVRNGPTERFILISGTGIHLAYGILDWLTLGPEIAPITVLIRVLGVLLLAPLYAWTFSKRGAAYIMWVSVAAALIMSSSMGLMLHKMQTITPPYYVGFIHLSLVFSSVLQINFRVCLSLLLSNYVIFSLAVPPITGHADFIAAHFFLIASFVSCAVVNYVLERNRRLEFVEYKEKQRYYDEVQRLANETEISLHRRNALLNVLGHVVKTPLHQIIGYAQVIEQTEKMAPEPTENLEFAAEIVRAGQTLSHQSQRILDYSRAEAGLLNVSLQTTNPERLVNEALHTVEKSAEDKKIAIESHCTDANIIADSRHMTLALNEIIGNAVKYCPPGSRIDIYTEETPLGILLSIKDNGPGIPESELGRVSDALNQTEEFRNMGGDRLGIGVSLACILARIAGGRLFFSSIPNAGSLAQILFAKPERQSETALKRAS